MFSSQLILLTHFVQLPILVPALAVAVQLIGSAQMVLDAMGEHWDLPIDPIAHLCDQAFDQQDVTDCLISYCSTAVYLKRKNKKHWQKICRIGRYWNVQKYE